MRGVSVNNKQSVFAFLLLLSIYVEDELKPLKPKEIVRPSFVAQTLQKLASPTFGSQPLKYYNEFDLEQQRDLKYVLLATTRTPHRNPPPRSTTAIHYRNLLP